jgi:hypothetical protein
MNRNFLRAVPLLFTLMLALGLLSGSTASAAAPATSACEGGVLAAGTYPSLTITGDCSLPDTGTINVNGNLVIADGATFNGQTGATINVSGSLFVGTGAAITLGCSPAAECEVTTADHIGGNVIANKALAVILHSDTIDGNILIRGGGGGVVCDFESPTGPAYSTVEDSQIGGNVMISGLRSCWLGFFRNNVDGNVHISGNILADPDATEVATNTIRGNLICSNNSPAAQVGDSEGGPNVVGGNKLGECRAL